MKQYPQYVADHRQYQDKQTTESFRPFSDTNQLRNREHARKKLRTKQDRRLAFVLGCITSLLLLGFFIGSTVTNIYGKSIAMGVFITTLLVSIGTLLYILLRKKL